MLNPCAFNLAIKSSDHRESNTFDRSVGSESNIFLLSVPYLPLSNIEKTIAGN